MLKITAIGNLTNDVTLKTNETTGKPYAILRIASDRRYKDIKTFPFDTVCGMPPRSSEWTDAAMTASATFAPGSSFREKMFIWRLWQIRTPLPM